MQFLEEFFHWVSGLQILDEEHPNEQVSYPSYRNQKKNCKGSDHHNNWTNEYISFSKVCSPKRIANRLEIKIQIEDNFETLVE